MLQFIKPSQEISKIKTAVLDLIFPKYCFGCGKEGSWLCSKCHEKILRVKTQICPKCGRISQNGRYCKVDRNKYLQGVITACYYEEGPIKELIHNFKYNNITELKSILGEYLVLSLKENLPKKDVIISAVPLHFLRHAQRGYNQSELLAEFVAEKLKLQKNFNLIIKNHYSKPQVLTEGKKRRKNLVNCYKINKNINIKNKTIVLIDDVTTTGATLKECAKVLKDAGAKRVWGLVIAKG